MAAVVLVRVGESDGSLLAPLADGVQAALGCPVTVAAEGLDAEDFYDVGRCQYWSTPMLPQLAARSVHDEDRVLGLTTDDLFIPVLTFVFGEASLAGVAAVVSTHRLQPEVYGLPADAERLRQRTIKESVHELGHTFGLVHCHHPACVMRASRAVDDVDVKSSRFCSACARQLREVGVDGVATLS